MGWRAVPRPLNGVPVGPGRTGTALPAASLNELASTCRLSKRPSCQYACRAVTALQGAGANTSGGYMTIATALSAHLSYARLSGVPLDTFCQACLVLRSDRFFFCVQTGPAADFRPACRLKTYGLPPVGRDFTTGHNPDSPISSPARFTRIRRWRPCRLFRGSLQQSDLQCPGRCNYLAAIGIG